MSEMQIHSTKTESGHYLQLRISNKYLISTSNVYIKINMNLSFLTFKICN